MKVVKFQLGQSQNDWQLVAKKVIFRQFFDLLIFLGKGEPFKSWKVDVHQTPGATQK